MGCHLTEDGRFRSDKYDWCPPGFFALKLSDPTAQEAALLYASLCPDAALADDLVLAVQAERRLNEAQPQSGPRARRLGWRERRLDGRRRLRVEGGTKDRPRA